MAENRRLFTAITFTTALLGCVFLYHNNLVISYTLLLEAAPSVAVHWVTQCLVLFTSECPRRSHSFTRQALCPVALFVNGYVNWNFLSSAWVCLSICCLFTVSPDPALFINLPSGVGRLKSHSPLAFLPSLTKAHFYWDFLACYVLQIICYVSDSPLDLLQVGEFSLL